MKIAPGIRLMGFLLAALTLSAPALADEEKRLLVMDVAHSVDTKPDFARTITELVTSRIDEVTEYRTVSGAEIRNLVALEGEKNAIGCDDASCLAEVAGAMGASFVVFGRLSRLGETLVLQLGLFDAERAEAVGRKTIKAANIDEIAARLDASVDELVGVKSAAERSKKPVESEPAALMPMIGYSVAGVGGVTALVGVLVAGVSLGAVADTTNAVTARKEAQGGAWTGIVVGGLGLAVVGAGVGVAMMGGE